MWLLAVAALATEDECLNGHVHYTATDVYLKPLGNNDGVTAIRQAEFNAQGNNLDNYLDRYVTVTDDDGNMWPDSTYLIANSMVLKRSSVVGTSDPDWYYVHYSSYPANYSAHATNISIGAMVEHGQPILVTLTSWSAGCAPEEPPSPSHPPSPPPVPPGGPPPPMPPTNPPPPPPHDGYYEFWMTPVLFGLLGPIVVILCLVTAVNTCNLYTFTPRPGEVKAIREQHAALNNGEVLEEFPGVEQYRSRLKMAETLRRAVLEPQQAAAETEMQSKRVGWR